MPRETMTRGYRKQSSSLERAFAVVAQVAMITHGGGSVLFSIMGGNLWRELPLASLM